MSSRSVTAARPQPVPDQPPDAAAVTWSQPARCIASALIVLHLAAVFVGPFAFACTTESGSSSPFADGLIGCLRPYINVMYLNHGYSFFAPRVGASHLVRYRIDFDDGRESIEGIFPDLKTQRPRLLYHRHFMLAESLNNAYAFPEEPPEMPLDPDWSRGLSDSQKRALEAANRRQHREQLRLWKHSRDQYDALRHSLEKHLLAVHGGSRVTLTRVEHDPLRPHEFVVLGKLDAPQSFRNLPEGRAAPEVIRQPATGADNVEGRKPNVE